LVTAILPNTFIAGAEMAPVLESKEIGKWRKKRVLTMSTGTAGTIRMLSRHAFEGVEVLEKTC
jgi:hypothetical protein